MKSNFFFLTVDTEGDNIWDRPSVITAHNTGKLHRFQELCNAYAVKPIYLVNYEAACNDEFVAFYNAHKDACEIGLHLHAWNSPPIVPLTANDYHYQPYLHEYPDALITEKLEFLINFLKERFQTSIISHRGGRYSTSQHMFDELVRLGIKIDCSYTPGVSWANAMGDPSRSGGPDYFDTNENIHAIKTLHGDLIEIPVSIAVRNRFIAQQPANSFIRRLYGKLFGSPVYSLRSTQNNFPEMKKVVDGNIKRRLHLEYIIHSSELVKGYSKLYDTQEGENVFYDNLEKLFVYLREQSIKSLTFKDYYNAQLF